jgi:hypothetical protein
MSPNMPQLPVGSGAILFKWPHGAQKWLGNSWISALLGDNRMPSASGGNLGSNRPQRLAVDQSSLRQT